jgi:hypothetical protein
MLIPNKFNGYSRDGKRIYYFGGGGGGDAPAAAASPTPSRLPSAAPPPVFQTYGSGDKTGSLVQSGGGLRPSTLDYSKPIYDPNYANNVIGYKQSSQFYQPIYQQQYENYATTNPLGVSQYGTPMTARSLVDSAYAGIGRYGMGNQVNQIDPGGRQYWESKLMSGEMSPQDFFSSFNYGVNQARQNLNSPYGQYLQNQTGYSGADFGRGYAQQPMQQMQTPFNYQQPAPNYGPSQAIVGRSSQMRGTPNVMRRAEGGIATLLDKDK